jgi:site-specific DNA-methyltransferase (adenine-specific)
MRYLVRLVTPPGGTVLDPWAGSGTTAEAAQLEDLAAIVMERDPAHIPDIHARLARSRQVQLGLAL